MKKKILSVILTLSMVLTMVSPVVFATDSDAPIDGEPTVENTTELEGEGEDNGAPDIEENQPEAEEEDKTQQSPSIEGVQSFSVTQITVPLDFTSGSLLSGDGYDWNSTSKTLTLNGLDLAITSTDKEYAIKLPGGAKIVLTAGTTNTIAYEGITETEHNSVILVDPDTDIEGNLTIESTTGTEGILNVNNNNATGDWRKNGIFTSNNLTINSGTINVEILTNSISGAQFYGISTGGTLSITGGTINSVAGTIPTGSNNTRSVGIYADNLNITGGIITATGGGITSSATMNSASYGIWVKNATSVTGGTVIAKCGTVSGGKPYAFNFTAGTPVFTDMVIKEGSGYTNTGYINSYNGYISQTSAANSSNPASDVKIFSPSAFLIDSTEYETLALAAAAVQAGETITAQKKYSFAATVVLNNGVTLDLNGKTLTYTGTTGAALSLTASTGDYIITDNSSEKGGKLVATNGTAISVGTAVTGNLNIKDVEISASFAPAIDVLGSMGTAGKITVETAATKVTSNYNTSQGGTINFVAKLTDRTASPKTILTLTDGKIENTATSGGKYAVFFDDRNDKTGVTPPSTPNSIYNYFTKTAGTVGKIYPHDTEATIVGPTGTSYPALATAITIAENLYVEGQLPRIVQLQKNITLKATQAIENAVTLDLNGYEIVGDETVLETVTLLSVTKKSENNKIIYGKLTVMDTATGGKISVSQTANKGFLNAIKVETGTEKIGAETRGSELIIHSGEIFSKNYSAIVDDGSKGVTINGGHIHSDATAVVNPAISSVGGSATVPGRLNVTGGLIESKGCPVRVNGRTDMSVSGTAVIKSSASGKPAIQLDKGSSSGEKSLTITGGTIDGGAYSAILFDETANCRLSISGGLVTNNVSSENNNNITPTIKTKVLTGTDKVNITVSGGKISNEANTNNYAFQSSFNQGISASGGEIKGLVSALGFNLSGKPVIDSYLVATGSSDTRFINAPINVGANVKLDIKDMKFGTEFLETPLPYTVFKAVDGNTKIDASKFSLVNSQSTGTVQNPSNYKLVVKKITTGVGGAEIEVEALQIVAQDVRYVGGSGSDGDALTPTSAGTNGGSYNDVAGKRYSTLQAAIAPVANPAGAEVLVVLLANVQSVTADVSVNKTMTLDLNKFGISLENTTTSTTFHSINVTNSNTLTVKNTAKTMDLGISPAITSLSTSGAVVVDNSANFILESGTISGKPSITGNNGSTVTIKGGVLNQAREQEPSRIASTPDVSIKATGASNVYIEGGIIHEEVKANNLSVKGNPVIEYGINLSDCNNGRITISGELTGDVEKIKLLSKAAIANGTIVAIATKASDAVSLKLQLEDVSTPATPIYKELVKDGANIKVSSGYNISGVITDDAIVPVGQNDWDIQLYKGDVKVERKKATSATVSTVDGAYTIENVLPGSYNIVATKTDNGKTYKVDELVTISNKNETKNLTIPSGNKSSETVILNPETPKVMVGGLNQLFNGNDASFLAQNTANTVEVKFTAEKRILTGLSDEVIRLDAKAKPANKKIEMYIDLKVIKAFTGTNAPKDENLVDLGSNFVDVVISLPDELVGRTDLSILRIHENVAQELQAGTIASVGEYYEIISANEIHLHLNKFSIYAIAIGNTPPPPPPPPGGDGDSTVVALKKNPKTGFFN